MMENNEIYQAYRNGQKLYRMAKEMYHNYPNEFTGEMQKLAWNLYTYLYGAKTIKDKYVEEEIRIDTLLYGMEADASYVEVPTIPPLIVDTNKKPLF